MNNSVLARWAAYEAMVLKPAPGCAADFKLKCAFYAGFASALRAALEAPTNPKDFARFMNDLEKQCLQHMQELRASMVRQ